MNAHLLTKAHHLLTTIPLKLLFLAVHDHNVQLMQFRKSNAVTLPDLSLQTLKQTPPPISALQSLKQLCTLACLLFKFPLNLRVSHYFNSPVLRPIQSSYYSNGPDWTALHPLSSRWSLHWRLLANVSSVVLNLVLFSLSFIFISEWIRRNFFSTHQKHSFWLWEHQFSCKLCETCNF